MRSLQPKTSSLLADERAFVVTIELVLVTVVAVTAALVGWVASRDAIIGEISDLAGAVQDLNQCYMVTGTSGHSATTHGMDYVDSLDFCDEADDIAGSADNCIVFNDPPSDEGGVSTEGLALAIDFSTDAGDSSPNGNDNSGTLEGDASIVDGTLVLDGDGDSVSIVNTDDINLGTHEARTIVVDFKIDDTSDRQVLYEEGGTVRGLIIYVDSGMLYVGGWNTPDSESDWEPTFTSTPITAGNWGTAAIVLDGGPTLQPGALTGYFNGTAFGSTPGSQLWEHSGGIAIGGANGRTRFHDGTSNGSTFSTGGMMDNFKLYNRPLSASEIGSLSL